MTEPVLPPATRDYLLHPDLAPLWDAVRGRLERNGIQVTGIVTVLLEEQGADRLSGLLGRRATSPARVRLTDVDAALRRSAAATGLVTVIEALHGPLVDRRAARAARTEARTSRGALLDAALADAGIGDQEWVPRFVERARLAGILTKAGDGAATAVGHAGAVLSELAATGALDPTRTPQRTSGWGLAELATRCTGDAHGLDSGRVAAALVLRAAAAAHDLRPPESAAEVRNLWTLLGVVPDELSGTVLVWSLRPPDDDPWSVMMRTRADLGLVTHLTLHELHGAAATAAWSAAGTTVSVCENPQVLQAAARAGKAGVLMCTSGNPASVGWVLIRGLVKQGAIVRYHGDFDWPGVAIAGRILASGVQPWRMSAGDYEDAVASARSTETLPLAGSPVPTPWDRQLAAKMSRLGVAVHEEALLGVLLADL
ncbi:MAG TPA: TIGR02679 family protein [Nocardioides sp.]|uniref:TIGR02679 family protein n=1 Tax=Nocardioides sp. TaxID=35761 RepID=UPI002C8FD7B9|nr:TIGR02679 family protein [Nocardioides sp.]HTW16290.1 TIGR02679 family protein [Nocardioides sp.]